MRAVSPTAATLSVPDLEYLAKVAAAGLSADDMTPVITGAHVTLEPGLVRVVATDRYIVMEAWADRTDPNTDAAKGVVPTSFIAPFELLEFIRRIAKRMYGTDQVATLGFTPDPVDYKYGKGTIRLAMRETTAYGRTEYTVNMPAISGTYPPVVTLLDKADAAPSMEDATGPIKLFMFKRFAAAQRHPDENGLYRFVSTGGDPNARAGQVFAQFENARGLLQRPQREE